jgi:LPS sulfotransferase NodH
MRADPHEHAGRRAPFAKDAAAEALLAAANEELATLAVPPPDEAAASLPLVYVVGAPRSGTTLVHQLLARHLPLGYVDNVTARFWRRPSVGVALSRQVLGEPGTRAFALGSRHGVTDEPAGPHEFGYFGRRWLRLDDAPTHHLDDAAQARVDADGLGAALAELRSAFGRPVVLKNVICGFHARLLTAIHPPSLFVHVVRDTEEVARSILQARLDRYGEYGAWWSLKPSTWPFHGLSPAAAVVRQALDCRAEIADELAAEEVRALEVAYAELCADPRALVDRVAEEVGALGTALPVVGDVPARLTASAGPAVPPALGNEIRAQVLSSR